MPKGFHPTPEERRTIMQAKESLFPLAPRKQGVLFDLYVSNPDGQGYPLEEVSVPTLIVNARDDACQPLRTRPAPPNAFRRAAVGDRARWPHAAGKPGAGRRGDGKVTRRQAHRLAGGLRRTALGVSRRGCGLALARPTARSSLGHQLTPELPGPLLELRSSSRADRRLGVDLASK